MAAGTISLVAVLRDGRKSALLNDEGGGGCSIERFFESAEFCLITAIRDDLRKLFAHRLGQDPAQRWNDWCFADL